MNIEQVKDKAKELTGTSGGDALMAVVKACKMLEEHKGRLDARNTDLAVMALIKAIVRPKRQAKVIIDLADRVRDGLADLDRLD
jgi:hypothetical protein